MIVTKTLIPRRQKGIIRRPRLSEMLLAAPGQSIILLRAPAGFGKTTLLVDLAHESAVPVSWLSLDEWDSDPVTFLGYLESATIAMETGDSLAPFDDERQRLERITEHLAARENWLVIDDLHCLDNAPDVRAFVDRLVRLLPPACRLAITSRTSMGLPSIPKARLEGRVIEISSSELAFTVDEIDEFRQQLGAKGASAETILARTSGWPAAVVFLSRDASTKTDEARTAHLFDFLAAEVLDRLSPELRDLLLRTSVLEELTAEGCDFLLDIDRSVELLRRLSGENVPMIELRAETPTYRLHDLFREFLLGELHKDRESYRALQARAAAWCLRLGQIGPAARHAAQAERWEDLCHLIETEAPEAYRRGQWHTIVSWLELVPDEMIRARPGLLIWRARVLVRLARTDQALQVIHEAIVQLGGHDDALLAEMLTLKGTALRVRGDAAESLAVCRSAVGYAIESNASIETLCEARKHLGLALYVTGALPEAVDELKSVLDIYDRRGDAAESAFVNACIGSALGSQGKLAESAVHLDRARQQWQAVGNFKELSWVCNNLAVTHLSMGDIPEARRLLDQSLKAARQAGHERAEAYALLTLADTDLMQADADPAERRYNAAREIADSIRDDSILAYAIVGLAEVRRRRRDLPGARALAEQAAADANSRGAPVERAAAEICGGRILRDQGHFTEAVAAFTLAGTLLAQTHSAKEQVEALYELAVTRLLSPHRRRDVVAILAQIQGLVRELGYDSFLVPLVRENPIAAEYGASRGVAHAYFKELLRRSRGEVPARESESSIPAQPPARYPRIRVTVFGSVAISADGISLSKVEWESGKGPELLLALLLSDSRSERDELLAALWPDSPPRKAVSSFHSTVHRLRRALYRECITVAGGAYALNPAGEFHCDLIDFRMLIRQAERATPPEALKLLEQAVALYGAGLASSLSAEWTEELRGHLEFEFLRAANTCSTLAFANQAYQLAVDVSRRALEVDQLNEVAWVNLIEGLLAQGDQAAALTYYDRYAQLLHRETNEPPSDRVRKLRGRILDADEREESAKAS